MTLDHVSALHRAIEKLAHQESAVDTVQEILDDLGNLLDIRSIAFISLKPKSDILEIKHYRNVHRETIVRFRRRLGNGVFSQLANSDKIIEATQNEQPEEYLELKLEKDYEKVLGIRVISDRQVVGFLIMYFTHPIEVTEESESVIRSMALVCGEAYSKDFHKEKVKHLERFEKRTGLMTHSYFLTRLKQEHEKSIRYNVPLTIAIIGIDNLEEITDIYGEEVTHDLFIELADALKGCVRGIDVLGHYGANEFILFMPHTSLENSEIVTRRFEEVINSSVFTSKGIQASMAVGVSQFEPGLSFENIVGRSHAAFHNAKVSGQGLFKRVLAS